MTQASRQGVEAAEAGDWRAAKYWLQTRSKDDRWRTAERREISYVGGIDVSTMTDAELQQELDALQRKRAALARPRPWETPAEDPGSVH